MDGWYQIKLGLPARVIDRDKAEWEATKYPYSYLNLAVIYKENNDIESAIDIISEGIKMIDVKNLSFSYDEEDKKKYVIKENENDCKT